MRRALALLTTLLAATAGCSPFAGGDTGATDGNGELGGSITVDAASSLTEAFETLKAQFEHAHPGLSIKISYGASSDLATQIGQGAPADVFAAASQSAMDDLGDRAVDPTDFVSNTLEIAVPPGNPAHIESVEDLTNPGVKIAVCDPEVPCGEVAAKVFENAQINIQPAANLADVKSTLAAVESGEVDAGLVYVTDVRAATGKVDGVTIPAAVNASTTYPIAVLKDTDNRTLADAFVAFVLSGDGRRVLTAAGFARP